MLLVTNDGRMTMDHDLLLRMMWLSPSGLVTRPIPDLSSNLAVTSSVMSDPCLKVETLTRHIAIKYEVIMVQKCFTDSWFSSELGIIYK